MVTATLQCSRVDTILVATAWADTLRSYRTIIVEFPGFAIDTGDRRVPQRYGIVCARTTRRNISDDATLNPRHGWHAHSLVVCAMRSLQHVRAEVHTAAIVHECRWGRLRRALQLGFAQQRQAMGDVLTRHAQS